MGFVAKLAVDRFGTVACCDTRLELGPRKPKPLCNGDRQVALRDNLASTGTTERWAATAVSGHLTIYINYVVKNLVGKSVRWSSLSGKHVRQSDANGHFECKMRRNGTPEILPAQFRPEFSRAFV